MKFDFLGLTTLTILDRAIKLVRRRGIDLDLAKVPLDDTKTYDALARGETVGVFQVESAGMRRALVDMRPDRFEDLIVLVALYRPGPMANIPTYCARKIGHERVDYLHPKLEPILVDTFGIITYQEQVMKIAQDLAGYSLGEADLLRRAMGKRIRSEMEKQRERFLTGAIERGIGRGDAEAIFEACAKFADYGFNKSHSAPYALLTYHTAYMKANYPVEFLAASMTLAMGSTDKLAEFRAEAERLGIKVEPPSVNRSGEEFDVDGNVIYYALAALRGVGRQTVQTIVAARGERPFTDLADFAGRVSPRALNKRVLEKSGRSGGVRCLRAQSCAGVRRPRYGAGDRATDPGKRGSWPIRAVRWSRRTRTSDVAGARSVAAGRTAAARVRRGGIFSLRSPARRLCGGAQAAARAVMGGILPCRESRRRGRARRRHGGGAYRTAHAQWHQDGHHRAVRPERTLRGGAVCRGPGAVSRPAGTGHGGSSLSTAEVQAEEVRARIQSVEPLDAAASKMQMGLRVFLRNEEPIAGVARRLEPARNGTVQNGAEAAAGEVSMVLMLGNGSEVEVKLPGRFKVSPQIAGAIKAVTGVVTVEAL